MMGDSRCPFIGGLQKKLSCACRCACFFLVTAKRCLARAIHIQNIFVDSMIGRVPVATKSQKQPAATIREFPRWFHDDGYTFPPSLWHVVAQDTVRSSFSSIVRRFFTCDDKHASKLSRIRLTCLCVWVMRENTNTTCEQCHRGQRPSDVCRSRQMC